MYSTMDSYIAWYFHEENHSPENIVLPIDLIKADVGEGVFIFVLLLWYCS